MKGYKIFMFVMWVMAAIMVARGTYDVTYSTEASRLQEDHNQADIDAAQNAGLAMREAFGDYGS